MKKVLLIALIMAVSIAGLTGAIFFLFFKNRGQAEEPENKVDPAMFSAMTERKEFQDIPKMVTANGSFSKPEDYGGNDWVIRVSGSTTEEYMNYLELLENSGFTKFCDNGDDAMEGYVYSSTFTKDELTYTLSHVIRQNLTYLVAGLKEKPSPHLNYQESYMDGVREDAKTELHMVQLYHINGNSFIIKLRNGHFIIEDGGNTEDAPYLLDYLESLTPAGEKPFIEGWFISHAHNDHVGCLTAMSEDQSFIDRIYLDGVYFVEPATATSEYLHMDSMWGYVTARLAPLFHDANGAPARSYRMHLGQRYYFCDITIDVPLTLEQLPLAAYYDTDFNDTSTWLMHHIEGQKFLHGGDSHHAGMRTVMEMYDPSYFEMDVYAVFHHGINVWDYFTDYALTKVKTLLYPGFRTASIWNPDTDPILGARERNQHLQELAEEYVSFGDGTVVLTFPYKVGTYEVRPAFDWRYNGGSQDYKEDSSAKPKEGE
ncbi:MAG: hypothetical protein IK088_00045 [Lachnospiraceae bacterium]|nr:hypothetical protein [Lachnospiraceae bacterium]